MYLIGSLAYAMAVFERTTFGVVGVQAAERFDASAGIVSMFAVMQLAVYAAMQIPAGLLLDRFGSRTLLAVGSAVMFAGQLLMAGAENLPQGIAARVLVGAGDATMFSSAIRLIPAWFPPQRAPLLTQVTNMIGQSGQIASSVGFAYAATQVGWEPAFFGAAVVALVAAVATGTSVRDTPHGRVRPASGESRSLLFQVRAAWANPGTRMGFWSHWTSCYPTLVFVMLWGYTYLIDGEGVSGATAGSLMTLYVVTLMVLGPLVGQLAGRLPQYRVAIVLGASAVTTSAWALVLLWPGPAPLPALVLLCVGVGVAGNATALSFDFPRSYAPPERLGTAIGVANTGGFTAGLLAIFTVGLVLDFRTGGRVASSYSLIDFRIALATQAVFTLIGVAMLLRTHRQLRAYRSARGQ